MIHLTVETAGLYAQVLPALVIVLLLEGRTKMGDYPHPFLALVVDSIRVFALLSGIGLTMLCLYLVGSNQEGSLRMDSFAAGTLVLLTVSMAVFVGKSIEGNTKLYRKYQRKRAQGKRPPAAPDDNG